MNIEKNTKTNDIIMVNNSALGKSSFVTYAKV